MSTPSLVRGIILGVFALLITLPESAHSATSTVRGRHAVSRKARPPVSGIEGTSVRLKAPKGPRGARYVWDLDRNGRYERKGRVISATFTDNGTYKVRYKVIAPKSSGNKRLRGASRVRRGTKRIAIANVPPSASAGSLYQAGPGEAVQFDGSASDQSREDRRAGYTYIWDFGDGSDRKSAKSLTRPVHRYNSPGTYTVSLTIKDKDGAKSSPATASVVVGSQGGSSPAPLPPPPPNATPVPPIVGPATTVNPTEIHDIIANPGMGWQSNDKVNTSGEDIDGLPNKVAYIKYYWRNIETADNVYDWSTMDYHLNLAVNNGQKWAFRIIVVEPWVSAPDWLRNQGVPGYWFNAEGGPQVWTPDFNDATARQKHRDFLQAVANRYGNHPGVDHVDIGSVGMWGEWHFGETNPFVPMPNQTSLNLIIDQYFDLFPNKPKIAQLEHQDSLTYAVQRGAGFRGDCLGNVNWQNRVSPPGMYDMRIDGANAENVWQTAPVVFETCWTIQYWVNQGWDVGQIVDWALANHVSGVNNKNAHVPSSAMPEIQRLLKYMGYRFVLRELRHPQSAHPGESVTISMDWQNIGVAPSYSDYVLAFQLRNQAGTEVARRVTGNTTRYWLPGSFGVNDSFPLPGSLAKGTYTLSLGLVDPATGNPAVQLAISGKDSAGWYPLSTLVIE